MTHSEVVVLVLWQGHSQLQTEAGNGKDNEKFIGVDDHFAITSHQANEGSIPLIHNLGEGRGARAHENLMDAVVELLDTRTHSQHTVTNAHAMAVQHLHPKCKGMPAPSAPSFVHL
jgi:hypothetical protein